MGLVVTSMGLVKTRQLEIDTIVYTMLWRIGLSYPQHSMDDILNVLGVPYAFEADLPVDVSGMMFIEDDKLKIAVNKNDNPFSRVFSLARELGHYMLGHVKNVKVGSNDLKYRVSRYNFTEAEKVEENEASYFASTLLVPEYNLRWAYSQNQDPSAIAQYFGVSEVVIVDRLKWVGLI